ncbi:unnamed protein product, partial [Rotaria sordida]
KYTSEFTVECSSNAAPTLSSLIGIHDQISSSSISFVQSEQDIISRNSTEASLISNGITEATSTHEVFEPIINNCNDVFADRQEEDVTTSTDIESIEKYTIDSTQTALTYEVFEPIINNYNDVFADRQQEDITTSTGIESIKRYTIDSTQTALTNETMFTSYNSSIQQVKIKSNKFGLTPSSIQNNSLDVTSTQSQSIYINDTSITEYHSEMASNSNNSYVDLIITYFDSNILNPSLHSQSTNFAPDHTFYLKKDLQITTPKGRRLLSESSEDERVFQSPYACSTPKLNGMKNNLTSSNFKTLSLTISLTPRRTPHFRKYFRTTKTPSQPDLN